MTIQLVPSSNGTTSSATTQSAIQAITSETLDTDNKGLRIGTLSITVKSTSFNAADSTVVLQMSNNNSNWENVTDGSMTIATGSATQSLTPVTYLAMRYYRVVYTPNSNTAGTIKILANLL